MEDKSNEKFDSQDTINAVPDNLKNENNKKPSKKGLLKTILLVMIVLILMAGSAGLAYWWRDKQANEEKANQSKTVQILQEQVDSLKTDKTDILDNSSNNNAGYVSYCDQFEWTPTTPSQSILDNIKAIITTANTEPLKGYLADNQNVVTIGLESSTSSSSNSGLFDITSFLESTSRVWDFNLSDLEMGFYNNGQYGSYFKNAGLIGKSDTGQIIAISFDCQSKIYKVLQAHDSASVR